MHLTTGSKVREGGAAAISHKQKANISRGEPSAAYRSLPRNLPFDSLPDSKMSPIVVSRG